MKIRDKVLIVEDEQNIKNFMSTILAANGFDTLMAGSAKEALSIAADICVYTNHNIRVEELD